MNEIDKWIDSARDKNKLLSKRESIMNDIYKLRMKPHYFIKINHDEIEDNDIITELILDYKVKQVKEIDKKLGINGED